MNRSKRPQRGPVDPLFAPAGHARILRKALQLCGQVRDALNRALPDCADPILQSLYVEGVSPAPDATHLLVLLGDTEESHEYAQVMAALTKARVRLRAEVAAEITRKRAPELSFNLRLLAGGEEE